MIVKFLTPDSASNLPLVQFKETITKSSKGEIEESNFLLALEVEPQARGKGIEFVCDHFISPELLALLKKSCKQGLSKGILAGFPLTDIEIRIMRASSLSLVEPNHSLIETLTQKILSDALKKGRPILLEPIVLMEFIVPEKYAGAIISDLNTHRAKILELENQGKLKVIRNEIPLREMFNYSTVIHSLTQGQGRWAMESFFYTELPSQIAQRIIEQRNNKNDSF